MYELKNIKNAFLLTHKNLLIENSKAYLKQILNFCK